MADDSSLLRYSKPPVTLNIEGTRVLYWPARSNIELAPSGSLVFIVGNPGLADYYTRYLTELQNLVHSDGRSTLEIFCISQLGHDPHALQPPQKIVTLDEQIQNKANILKAITQRWNGNQNRPKLIIAGHSIGAYMALEIVRRKLSPVPILSVHLLFPALHQIGHSPNARRLSWLLKADDRPLLSPYAPSVLMLLSFFVSIILRIVQFLPLPIVHFLVLCGAPSQPMEAIKITSDFILDSKCAQQAISMGREEMKLVKKVQALNEAEDGNHSKSQNGQRNGSALPVKLRAYWAAGDLDGWAPESTRLIVEETLGMQGYELPAAIIDKQKGLTPQRTLKKRKSYSVEEIRRARRSGSGIKRRALAGMVHAGASAGYGLASSLGNLGYRRGPPPRAPSSGMRNIQSPLGSPARTLRRRPSLVAARASRRFDGSIVIEPTGEDDDDSELDLLAEDPDNSLDGVVFSPTAIEPSLDEALKPGPTGKSAPSILDPALTMPDRASIVCKLGMPHAFVLEHSEKMAAISSAMIISDLQP
ncbi:hypothetical protein L7F22_050177 [Adiantum nelumboides]|nr:hypothetical protein [Adiantum nelumboides]